jgi:WD40 repeat protein
MLKISSAALAALLLMAGWVLAAANPVTTPDGKLRISADGKAVVVTDVATKKEVLKVRSHTEDVTALACSPDGKQIASGDKGGVVSMIDMATGRLLWKFSCKEAVASLAISNDGKTLTVGKAGKKTTTLDPATGKVIKP